MSQTNVQVMDTDDFLAHYGVKGMKWGRRKSRDSVQSQKAAFVKGTAKNLAVVGATQAGRIIGSSAGTVIGGPLLGSMIGGAVGASTGSKVAAKALYGKDQIKKDEAKKNIDSFAPNRNAKYSNGSAKRDLNAYGVDGAKRINAHMNSGLTLSQARQKEIKLRRTIALVSIGAGVAQTVLVNKGVNYLKSPQANAKAYQYAAKKGAQRNLKRSMMNGVKPNRQGAYKITTLK